MTSIAKFPYVEAQRDASRSARKALEQQFVAAGHDEQKAKEIVDRHVRVSSARFESENSSLFDKGASGRD